MKRLLSSILDRSGGSGPGGAERRGSAETRERSYSRASHLSHVGRGKGGGGGGGGGESGEESAGGGRLRTRKRGSSVETLRRGSKSSSSGEYFLEEEGRNSAGVEEVGEDEEEGLYSPVKIVQDLDDLGDLGNEQGFTFTIKGTQNVRKMSEGAQRNKYMSLVSLSSFSSHHFDALSPRKQEAIRQILKLRYVILAYLKLMRPVKRRRRSMEISNAEQQRDLRRQYSAASMIAPLTGTFRKEKNEEVEDLDRFCDEYGKHAPAIVHRHIHGFWTRSKQTRTEPRPAVEKIFATLLFADISGFTRLSATLSAEELKTHTNKYFTMLIGVVQRYGGDIIKFCGDAVLILWPSAKNANRETKSANSHLAAECSLSLLRECGTYYAGRGKNATPLRLHCGIGIGLLHSFYVGHENRWEFLIAGDPLRQIGECEGEATQGEVIVSPETWAFLKKSFIAEETAKKNYKLLKTVKDEELELAQKALSKTSSFYPFGDKSARSALDHNAKGSLENTARSMIDMATGRASDGGITHRLGSADGDSSSPTTSLLQTNLKTLASLGSSSKGLLQSAPEGAKTHQDSLSLSWHGSNQSEEEPMAAHVLLYYGIKTEVYEKAMEYIGSFLSSQAACQTSQRMAPLSKALRGYAHESARHAIETSTVGYLAELRRVTTIFIEIRGLEEALQNGQLTQVQSVMEAGVACFTKFGGTMRQFVVDDKGCVMIAAFGLPHYAYENNDRRAIQTAMAVRNALNNKDLHCKIGIANGNVYCGLVGSEQRCEYAMMGCSVNLSARLMAACAEDDIKVDHEVYQQCQDEFQFEDLKPIKAKGYVDPVPVYRPMQEALTRSLSFHQNKEEMMATDRDIMIGRRQEIGTIGDVISKVKKQLVETEHNNNSGGPGRSKVEKEEADVPTNIYLIGEAGSGKSNLLQSKEFAKLIKESNVECYVGLATSVNEGTSFYAWGGILFQIFGISDLHDNLSKQGGDQGSGGYTAAVHKWISSNFPSRQVETIMKRAPLLELIAPFGFRDNHFVERLEPEDRARYAEDLVIDILRAAYRSRPIIIVVDDVQWMDLRSWKLFRIVVKSLHHVIPLLSMRPLGDYHEVLPEEFIALYSQSHVIELGSLNPEECFKLAQLAIGQKLLRLFPSMLPEDSGQALHDKSTGNPMILKNIVYLLKDSFTKGNPQRLQEIPSAILEDLIISRFDGLTQIQQIVLKSAAVAGTTFSEKILVHLLPNLSHNKTQDVHGALVNLITLNFIDRVDSPDAEGHFKFVHIPVQDAVYKLMLREQIESLHGMCAAWYENNGMPMTPAKASVITHHYMRSDDIKKKIEYLQLSAMYARRAFANEEVVQHYISLVALAFDLEPSQLAVGLAEKQVVRYRSSSSTGSKKFKVRLLNVEAKIMSRLRSFYHQGWKSSNRSVAKSMSFVSFNQGRNLSDGNRALRLKWIVSSDIVASTEHLVESVNPRQIGQWFGELGLSCFRLGRIKAAHNFMQIGLAYLKFPTVSTKSGRPFRYPRKKREEKIKEDMDMAAALYDALGTTFLVRGNQCGLRMAVKYIKRYPKCFGSEGLEARIRYGMLHKAMSFFMKRLMKCSGSFLSNQAHCTIALGDHAAAATMLGEAKILSEKCTDNFAIGNLHYAYGIFLLAVGKWKIAMQHLRTSSRNFLKAGDSHRACECFHTIGFLFMMECNLTMAEESFKEILEIGERTTDEIVKLNALQALALTYVVQGDCRRSSDLYHRSQEIIGATLYFSENAVQGTIFLYEKMLHLQYIDAMNVMQLCIKKFCEKNVTTFNIGIYLHFALDAILSLLETIKVQETNCLQQPVNQLRKSYARSREIRRRKDSNRRASKRVTPHKEDGGDTNLGASHTPLHKGLSFAGLSLSRGLSHSRYEMDEYLEPQDEIIPRHTFEGFFSNAEKLLKKYYEGCTTFPVLSPMADLAGGRLHRIRGRYAQAQSSFSRGYATSVQNGFLFAKELLRVQWDGTSLYRRKSSFRKPPLLLKNPHPSSLLSIRNAYQSEQTDEGGRSPVSEFQRLRNLNFIILSDWEYVQHHQCSKASKPLSSTIDPKRLSSKSVIGSYRKLKEVGIS